MKSSSRWPARARQSATALPPTARQAPARPRQSATALPPTARQAPALLTVAPTAFATEDRVAKLRAIAELAG